MKVSYVNEPFYSQNKNTSFKIVKNMCNLEKIINDFRIPYCNQINLPENTQFGLELEFENVLLSELNNKLEDYQLKNGLEHTKDWCVVDDMSVSQMYKQDYIGGEVNSPILTGTKKDWKSVADVCDIIQKMDARITQNCGFHAHFDFLKLGITKEELWNLISLWYKYEEVIDGFARGEAKKLRSGVTKNASSIRPYINKLIKYSRVDAFLNGQCVALDKNHALNTTHYQDYYNGKYAPLTTIEFRIGNGTLNPVIIQNYIRFYGNLLKTIKQTDKNYSIDKELKEPLYFNMQSNLDQACEFVDTIFDNNFDKMCFLKQYTKKRI